MELAGIAALGLVSGLMIGCIGIGGVILVPALVFLDGIPIKIGIPAAALFSANADASHVFRDTAAVGRLEDGNNRASRKLHNCNETTDAVPRPRLRAC